MKRKICALLSGMVEDTFAPDRPAMRTMLWSMLASMDAQAPGGEPWYAAAQQWAKAHGVSDGINPEGGLTREQLAAMLQRYAENPAATGSLEGFPDGGSVSAYAVDAMCWAVGEGLITGMGDGTLNPQGGVTRAQIATVFMRYGQLN